ncbi:MAG: ATP-binding cassette domain-containing protein [Phycisphaeraceae bacterium]|nr:ATP-binding cassette domain-containing protein [Phycisphaeraceae bacterium]
MIHVQDLVKRYGPNLAVDRVSFEVPQGQIVGFLGPNGAGKTTTMRILTGYLPPTSGGIQIAGFDVLRQSLLARQKIGYLPEHTPLYPEMRVDEYLDFRGRLHGMGRRHRRGRINVVVDRCGLMPVRRRQIGRLSRGNRQRVGIAQALLHEPPVLILDEPTAGLDPHQVTAIRQLFSELRGEHTILLSTHILPEVEKNADRVIILAGGRIVADGTPGKLREQVGKGAKVRIEARAPLAQVRRALEDLPQAESVAAGENDGWCEAIVTPKPGADGLREAVGRAAATNSWTIRQLSLEQASLEAFFIQITAAQHQAPAGVESAA